MFLHKLFTIISSTKIFANYKRIFLKIDSKQGVNMSKEYSIPKITNYKKQLRAPFETYSDFESNLKQFYKPKKDNASYTGKCQEDFVLVMVNQCKQV